MGLSAFPSICQMEHVTFVLEPQPRYNHAPFGLYLLLGEDFMTKSGFFACWLISFWVSGLQAGDLEIRELYALISANGSARTQAEALRNHFSGKQLADGSAVAAYGGDFVWALQAEQRPLISIDDGPAFEMRSVGDGCGCTRRV